VLASDMPFIDADFIRKMLNQIDDRYEAIVPKQNSKIQPLAAIYRRSALPILDSIIQQHKRSMKDLLMELKVCYVEFNEDCLTFVNINTQQDLLEIQKKEKNHE
jgi:molybdopterin-guanine dinucleotide biosynthesis protein A